MRERGQHVPRDGAIAGTAGAASTEPPGGTPDRIPGTVASTPAESIARSAPTRAAATATAAGIRASALAGVLVLAAAAVPATAAAQSAAAPGSVMERAVESRTKGADSASVVVFEIADFQCSYCARFAADVAPALDEKYVATDRIQWVFVNLPLHTHPLAWHAAEAALCAGVAGNAFWPMHDRLFAQQDSWSEADDPQALFADYAADLGVPAEAFGACTADDDVASLILQDLGSAVSAGITGTPTFIVMKDQQVVEQMVGVRSMEEWSRVLDGVLDEESDGESNGRWR